MRVGLQYTIEQERYWSVPWQQVPKVGDFAIKYSLAIGQRSGPELRRTEGWCLKSKTLISGT